MYTPVNSHSNWICISYWTWGFFQRVSTYDICIAYSTTFTVIHLSLTTYHHQHHYHPHEALQAICSNKGQKVDPATLDYCGKQEHEEQWFTPWGRGPWSSNLVSPLSIPQPWNYWRPGPRICAKKCPKKWLHIEAWLKIIRPEIECLAK